MRSHRCQPSSLVSFQHPPLPPHTFHSLNSGLFILFLPLAEPLVAQVLALPVPSAWSLLPLYIMGLAPVFLQVFDPNPPLSLTCPRLHLELLFSFSFSPHTSHHLMHHMSDCLLVQLR